MATCASCGEWMSALVYACPACGAKPKGPPPRGLVISDTLPALGFDVKEGGPRAPRKGGKTGSDPAQRPTQPPASEPFAKAPGPASGADPKRLDDLDPPPPAVRRSAPGAASRPPPRRPAPARKEPPPEPDDEAVDAD